MAIGLLGGIIDWSLNGTTILIHWSGTIHFDGGGGTRGGGGRAFRDRNGRRRSGDCNLFECELFVDADGVTVFDSDAFQIVDREIIDNFP